MSLPIKSAVFQAAVLVVTLGAGAWALMTPRKRHYPGQLPPPVPLQREVPTPHGTVTIVVDQSQGIMDIFAEHDPHPADWAMATALITTLCEPGTTGEPDYLKGIDTWRVALKR